MIYYALTSLMLASIREIQIITTPYSLNLYKNLLGNGDDFGIEISYATQDQPRGLADAFLVSEKFVRNYHSALILGDNLFHVENFSGKIEKIKDQKLLRSLKILKIIWQLLVFIFLTIQPLKE